MSKIVRAKTIKFVQNQERRESYWFHNFGIRHMSPIGRFLSSLGCHSACVLYYSVCKAFFTPALSYFPTQLSDTKRFQLDRKWWWPTQRRQTATLVANQFVCSSCAKDKLILISVLTPRGWRYHSNFSSTKNHKSTSGKVTYLKWNTCHIRGRELNLVFSIIIYQKSNKLKLKHYIIDLSGSLE